MAQKWIFRSKLRKWVLEDHQLVVLQRPVEHFLPKHNSLVCQRCLFFENQDHSPYLPHLVLSLLLHIDLIHFLQDANQLSQCRQWIHRVGIPDEQLLEVFPVIADQQVSIILDHVVEGHFFDVTRCYGHFFNNSDKEADDLNNVVREVELLWNQRCKRREFQA